MADVFGGQLLSNIEVVGFAELLQDVRRQIDTSPRRWFNCAQFDDVLTSISSSSTSSVPPILEVTSVGSGGGKSHLLYVLTSLSVLSLKHGGRDGCVIIVDADGKFNINRLTQQMRHRLRDWSASADESTIQSIIHNALHHVYVYKPQNMRAMVEMISDLPSHFIHQEHLSRDRCMSFVAIDSASAFSWQVQAEEEYAALASNVVPSSAGSQPLSQPLSQTTFADLRDAIEACSKSFQCPIIITSQYSGQITSSKTFSTGYSSLARGLRPSLPSPLSSLPVLRLITRRIPIKKIPQGLSLDELVREQSDRIKVVSRARFECVIDESSLNLAQVQALRGSGDDGFRYTIKQEGLTMEAKVIRHDNDEM